MAKVSAVKVHNVPITEIMPNPKNPRKISEERIQELCKSMKDLPEMINFRFIVVERKTGFILGGNQRWLAARKLGWETVPVAYADELTPEQRQEFIIRDNIDVGEWDEDVLMEKFADFPLVDWGLVKQLPDAEDREQDEADLAAAKETYDNAEVKQIVVYYDTRTHKRVTEALEKIKEENYFGDNAEALLFLLDKHE